MQGKSPRFGVRSLCLASLLAVTMQAGPGLAQTNDSVDGARQAELANLLRHDCGSCHGLTMKGGLGKPLLPDRLDAWSVAQLASVILDGVPGTPMPPWRPLLTEQEAQWIAQQLKQGLPQ